ncbi:hypothetical protein ACQUQU_11685 [Thalassolituus sp. LLYu03]|uniref:hypothetical protein n=1 Tax=Thalassolituus sp. LLYu03 TaxID=3421656 RepID=UPI003D2E7D15
MSAAEHERQLLSLMDAHFQQAAERVDVVYRQHFASQAAVLRRHWTHRRDIPNDLMILPRTLGRVLLRRQGAQEMSGKQQALRRILEEDLLDLPGLQSTLSAYCEGAAAAAGLGAQQLAALSQEQQQAFAAYLQRQLERLHLPADGVREGLLAIGIMLGGRVLGDKALLSSAASLGGTLATSLYVSQQSWWGALWAGWFGTPGWVTLAGAGSGIAALLLLSPLLAPGVELGMNRLRARRLLTQTVEQAVAQVHQPDTLLTASRLGLYLQLLPDLAQYLARLRGI